MAFARDTYTASAAQTDFTITFGYLAEEDVLVYLNGVLQTQGAGEDYTIVSTTTVRFNSGLSEDDAVVLVRSTSQTARIVDYSTASTLTEEDLDDDSLQAFYLAQEALDAAARALGLTIDDMWDATGHRITEVAEPTANADAATKIYVDEVLIAAGNTPAAAEAEDGDVLVVTTEGTVAWAELAEAYIPDGLIDAGMMAALTITEAELAAESITNAKIEDGAVNTEHFTAEAVNATAIEAAAVTLAKIDATAGTEGEYLRNEEATSVVWAEAAPAWTYHAEVDFSTLTEYDLVTGLPNTVNEIEIFLNNISNDANGTPFVLQLGGAVAYDVTGYVATGHHTLDTVWEVAASTAGFAIGAASNTAAESYSGIARLSRMKTGSDIWVCEADLSRDDGIASIGCRGLVSLEETLTRIQIMTPTEEVIDSGEAVVRYR